MKANYQFQYFKCDSYAELPEDDRTLLIEAMSATARSHSPYSNFRVGAAARLKSGEIVYGANIESEVYPAGICAERNLLFSTAATHPNDPIVALAIVSASSPRECYPCGVCRQSILDAERRQQSAIRVIMGSDTSATIVESAEALLPFSFIL